MFTARAGGARRRKSLSASSELPELTDTEVEQSEDQEATRRTRFGLLLSTVFAAFLISGLTEPSRFGDVTRVLLNGAALLLALYAAEVRPRVVRATAVFVVLAATGGVAAAFAAHPNGAAGRGIDVLLIGAALPAVAVGTVRNLRHRGTVTLEAVFGVLSLYILFGMFFAALFGFVAQIEGHTVFVDGESATVARCIYYSFTTLTTVGFGDLTTRTNVTHTLSVSEALLGQIYLVTVVSLIVSNLGREHGLARRAPRRH